MERLLAVSKIETKSGRSIVLCSGILRSSFLQP